jgi:hypothetical protein
MNSTNTSHLHQRGIRGALAALIVLATTFNAISAEDFTRKDKIELLIPGIHWDGHGFDAIGGGLAVNGHFTDHFAIGIEGAIGSADARGEDGLFYAALSSVEYNILKSRLTPFVTATGGIIELETHSGSWIFGDTDRTTRGAFGGGFGIRWDVTDHFVVKATYRALEITGADPGGLSHMFEIALGGSF